MFYAILVICFASCALATPCLQELAYQPIFTSPLTSYTSSDFNVICFGNFDSEGGGDLEGRVAVAGDLTFNSGFSVGYALWTSGPNATDANRPWSLVAGGSLTWPSGSLYPQGNGIPYPGEQEGMFVGGSITAPEYIASRQTAGPCTGCLDDAFQSAYNYYSALSGNFTEVIVNAQYSFNNDGIFLFSGDLFASRYYLQIAATDFNAATYWSTSNMNSGADFVVTITGDEDVTFQGGNFPGIPSQTVFNIPGTRNVQALNAVTGSILAPDANLIQPGGNLVGFAIVSSVTAFLDSYKPNCPSQICCQYCPPTSVDSFHAF